MWGWAAMVAEDRDTMSERSEVGIAVLKEIQRQVEALEGESYNAAAAAAVVRNLALAYRYAAGGQQPGGVALESA